MGVEKVETTGKDEWENRECGSPAKGGALCVARDFRLGNLAQNGGGPLREGRELTRQSRRGALCQNHQVSSARVDRRGIGPDEA
jgi:hypothetical protein